MDRAALPGLVAPAGVAATLERPVTGEVDAVSRAYCGLRKRSFVADASCHSSNESTSSCNGDKSSKARTGKESGEVVKSWICCGDSFIVLVSLLRRLARTSPSATDLLSFFPSTSKTVLSISCLTSGKDGMPFPCSLIGDSEGVASCPLVSGGLRVPSPGGFWDWLMMHRGGDGHDLDIDIVEE